MKKQDLDRVRNDLRMVQAALGLDAPTHKQELLVYLLLGIAGLIAGVWATTLRNLSPIWGFAAFLPPVAAWAYYSAGINQSSDERVVSRHELRNALNVLSLGAPLALLHACCLHMGLELGCSLGLMTFSIGTVLYSSAFGDRHARLLAAWGIPLILGGLAVSAEWLPPVVGIAAAIGIAGFASAVFVGVRLHHLGSEP